MNGTSLPIGGESTHSVLAAHRGLPAARLFTDIDQMQQGDMFYIHVLDETLAYQVDQILDMVEKDDHETLEDALQIQEGKDQVTLFTCTPYGVNSHRLLVRGTRVPYNGEEETENTPVDSMLRAIQNYYMLYLILGLAVTLLVILIMKFLFDRKNKNIPVRRMICRRRDRGDYEKENKNRRGADPCSNHCFISSRFIQCIRCSGSGYRTEVFTYLYIGRHRIC